MVRRLSGFWCLQRRCEWYNERVIHVFFTILSVLILTAAIVSRGGLPKDSLSQNNIQTEVLSEQDEEPQESSEPTPSVEPTLTPTPTSVATATQTNTPTATPTVNSSDGWIYPGSTVVRAVPLSLTSSADSKVVTDWYKARIKAEGFNTTSFIVTSTNDKIYNKLVAAKNAQKIEVLITRDTNTQPLSISVSITSQN